MTRTRAARGAAEPDVAIVAHPGQRGHFLPAPPGHSAAAGDILRSGGLRVDRLASGLKAAAEEALTCHVKTLRSGKSPCCGASDVAAPAQCSSLPDCCRLARGCRAVVGPEHAAGPCAPDLARPAFVPPTVRQLEVPPDQLSWTVPCSVALPSRGLRYRLTPARSKRRARKAKRNLHRRKSAWRADS
jgi:hypothetical protein